MAVKVKQRLYLSADNKVVTADEQQPGERYTLLATEGTEVTDELIDRHKLDVAEIMSKGSQTAPSSASPASGAAGAGEGQPGAQNTAGGSPSVTQVREQTTSDVTSGGKPSAAALEDMTPEQRAAVITEQDRAAQPPAASSTGSSASVPGFKINNDALNQQGAAQTFGGGGAAGTAGSGSTGSTSSAGSTAPPPVSDGKTGAGK
jgi:hypothetical protein